MRSTLNRAGRVLSHALLTARNLEEAAKSVGIAPNTLLNWMKVPEFQAEEGHNPPVLRRSSGGFERLDAGGVPLGVLAAARYEQGEVVLQSSDLVVVFTDGVVEAENERRKSTARLAYWKLSK